jgi:hypothetical protein
MIPTPPPKKPRLARRASPAPPPATAKPTKATRVAAPAEAKVHEGEIIPPDQNEQRLGIDWNVVRQDYERTSISIRELAARHGLKSDNSIRRRIVAEGWRRDIEEITAELVSAGVALPSHVTAHNAARGAHKHAHQNSRRKSGASAARTADDAPRTSARTSQSDRTERPARGDRVRSTADEDDRGLRTAKGLADIHQRSIRNQLDAAETARNAAVHILDGIARCLTAPAGSQELGEARGRLMMLSPDKDTMSTLSVSAIKLLEGAVIIERRALGMDRSLGPGANNPLGTAQGQAITEVMKRLPADMLLRLRGVAQDISRLPAQPEHPATPEDA